MAGNMTGNMTGNGLHRACQQCARSKLRCDGVRPCSRCVSRGEVCIDQPPPKPRLGRKRKRPEVQSLAACAPCAAQKKACDNNDPCTRCVRLGREADCFRKPGQKLRKIRKSSSSETKSGSEELASELVLRKDSESAHLVISPNVTVLNSQIVYYFKKDELQNYFKSLVCDFHPQSPLLLTDFFVATPLEKWRVYVSLMVKILPNDLLKSFVYNIFKQATPALLLSSDSKFEKAQDRVLKVVNLIDTYPHSFSSDVFHWFNCDDTNCPSQCKKKISGVQDFRKPEIDFFLERWVFPQNVEGTIPQDLRERPAVVAISHSYFEDGDWARCCFFNSHAEQLFGFTAKEFMDCNISRIMKNFELHSKNASELEMLERMFAVDPLHLYQSLPKLFPLNFCSLFAREQWNYLGRSISWNFVKDKNEIAVVNIVNRQGVYIRCWVASEARFGKDGPPTSAMIGFVPVPMRYLPSASISSDSDSTSSGNCFM